MKIHPLVLGLLITTVAPACHSTDEPSIPTPRLAVSDASIELSKGPCYGSCPEYSLVVSADGSLRWNGLRNVMAVGQRRATSDASQVANLFSELDALRFDDWFIGPRSTSYQQQLKSDGTVFVDLFNVTDAPRTTLTVARHGTRRALSYYLETDVGPALRQLEAHLLDLNDVRLWAQHTPPRQ